MPPSGKGQLLAPASGGRLTHTLTTGTITGWKAERGAKRRYVPGYLVGRADERRGRENLPLVRYSLKPYLRKNPGAER
jgi:hypothetical protein